jgi:dipeptidyl aminopeptidase/acylaminoacyl peptidase
MAHRPLWPLAALAVLALAAPAPARAQQPRRMTLVDEISVPSLGAAHLSPDGKQLVYVLSTADWKANRRVGHLWRVNVDGSGTVQLTNGPRGESDPEWSPDGLSIAFVATRDSGEAQIYVIANAGGEGRRLTHHATAISNITWSPSGDAIYFEAPEPPTAEEKEKAKLHDDVFSFDHNYKQRHLWKVSVATGQEQQITTGDFSVLGYALSRDGKKVAYHRGTDPLLGDAAQSEVWVMNADGSGAVQLTHNGVGERGARLSPDDGEVLFTAGANAQFDTYYNSKLFLEPAGGGTARLVDLPYAVDDAEWSPDGKAIYFVADLGVHSELFRLDLATQKTTQLTDGQHAIRDWALDGASGRQTLSFDEAANPGDVYLLAQDGGQPARITHVFDYLAKEFAIPRQEKITWKGADGVSIEGILYYPLGYQQGTRYPLIVNSHGGPQASDKFGFAAGWGSYVHALAAKGYAVLKPNYRGSTGYGDVFLRDMIGHYYKNAHLDVLAGVDAVIKMGVADSTKLAAMGWSAGGHMTDKLVTFTHRFKAASAGAGATDWISMYAESDTRIQRTPWFGGTPWQKNAPIDLYWDNSPLKYVSNVTTPTILFVGQQDPRVPMPQSVEMYRALTSNGVPTTLYVAPREPHGWAELRHQLFKMNAELGWFERYVMGRDYTWEEAPGVSKAAESAGSGQ